MISNLPVDLVLADTKVGFNDSWLFRLLSKVFSLSSESSQNSLADSPAK
jgi:hypothetical protein